MLSCYCVPTFFGVDRVVLWIFCLGLVCCVVCSLVSDLGCCVWVPWCVCVFQILCVGGVVLILGLNFVVEVCVVIGKNYISGRWWVFCFCFARVINFLHDSSTRWHIVWIIC